MPRSTTLLLAGSCALLIVQACSVLATEEKAAAVAPSDSLEIANEFVRTRSFQEAEPILRRILEACDARGDSGTAEAAAVLDQFVICLWQTGRSQLPETMALADRAIRSNEAVHGPDDLSVAKSLFSMGVIRAMGGAFAEAEPLFQRALEIREAKLPPGDEQIASSINALANIRFYNSDLEGSLHLYRRSAELAEESGGKLSPVAVSIRGNIANTLIQLGDYNEARTILEGEIELLESNEMLIEELGFAYSLLGGIFMYLGDLEGARTAMERSLEIREGIHPPGHPSIAQSTFNLGNILWKTGEMAEGREKIESALAMWEQTYPPDHAFIAYFYEALGRLCQKQENYADARAFHEKALAIRVPAFGEDAYKVGEVHQSLGRIAIEEGRYEEARIHLAEALRIVELQLGPDHPMVAENKSDLAKASFLGGDYANVAEDAVEAETIARDHTRLTLSALPERQALQAAQLRTSGLDLLLSVVDHLDTPELVVESWDALLRSRALVLDEMAYRNRLRSGDPSKVQSLVSYREASTRLANLYVRGPGDSDAATYRKLLDDARREMESAERELVVDLPWTDRARSLGWTEVANALPKSSALVAFALYDHYPVADGPGAEATLSYRAFVLPPKGGVPVSIEIGPAAEVDAAIAEWKREVSSGAAAGNRSPEEALLIYQVVARKLRRQIWDPITEYTAHAERVFVVPDGQLHLVSLGVLPEEDGSYLIESEQTFHYLSTERELVSGSTDRALGGALVLGAPDFEDAVLLAEVQSVAELEGAPSIGTGDSVFRGERPKCDELRSGSFVPLPASLEEAKSVAKRLGGEGDVLLLTGREASESAVKQLAPGSQTLHLATHGFFLDASCPSGLAGTGDSRRLAFDEGIEIRNPLLLSGLALAGANHRADAAAHPGMEGEDGILTAQEIAALDLSSVRSVVLSACETGTGEVLSGEGILGLRRAFRTAGAGTLVASLWSVQDVSTHQWMEAFYEDTTENGFDPLRSVRASSLELLQDRRNAGKDTHPFYWGAFIASGDWK